MTATTLPTPDFNLTPRGFSAFAAETSVLYGRSMRKLSRRPIILYFSLIQPIIWMLLFGQIFNRIARFPGTQAAFGGKSYFQFFVPAVILQTLLFGAGQSGIGIISDIQSGFLNKLLTTPIHRMAILLGRILGDMTRMTLQGAIIILIAFLAGLVQSDHVHYAYGFPGILAALAIGLLFGMGLSGFNVFIALKTKNTETTFLVSNFLTLPLLFTSSAQLPLPLLPTWLQHVAAFNPVTYAIESMRFLLNGTDAVPGIQPGALLVKTILILGIIATITMSMAVGAFRRAVR
jgi:ABC-2 type transport system permease protein